MTSTDRQMPELDLDPFSTDFFDDPYPTHERLRDIAPVVWLSKWDVYAIARYKEVHDVLHDHRNFCSSRGAGLTDFAKEKPWRPPSLILEADPPAHTRIRAVFDRILSPAVVRALREKFTRVAEDRTDELLARGSVDAIRDIAEAFPLSVFPEAVGLKKEGREHLLPYAGVVFNAFGPPNQLRQQAIERSAPHQAYVLEQCQRENLSTEGFGACIYSRVESGDIAEAEAPLLVRTLLSAGLDTTVNGLGAALYCLARFPDQWRLLRDDPGRARNAFEEAIRYESPVQTFFRTTTQEVTIGGFKVGAGKKVLMFLGAANRDPRKWEHPDSYDIGRRTSGHVGFGSGIHMCSGQFLARLEGEVMLSTLAKRVRAIEISGEIKRRYNNTLRGLESLPITLKRAS
ncbi:cytochrome P450 [Bradyrhizobium sp. TM239]|uniref:cytochrome P450 n=1 Tax=Bradyrhizobium sp. TM239 TaxID=2599802 RepID=UPI0027D4BFEC|nr:cytochrome P450 [Bradyrhizobium sp. TM239]